MQDVRKLDPSLDQPPRGGRVRSTSMPAIPPRPTWRARFTRRAFPTEYGPRKAIRMTFATSVGAAAEQAPQGALGALQTRGEKPPGFSPFYSHSMVAGGFELRS